MQGKHRCQIPLPCALPRPRPALLTQFPPDRLFTPISHPTSCLLSSSATPTPQLLLPWRARQHHLRRQHHLGRHVSSSFLSLSAFSYSPSPASHLFPAPLPISRCSPSAPAPCHTLRAPRHLTHVPAQIPCCTVHFAWLDPTRTPQESSSPSMACAAPRSRCSFEAQFARTRSFQDTWQTSKKTLLHIRSFSCL